jgi:hypothetical protein
VQLHDLTSLTGRRVNDKRTVTVKTVDVNRRLFVVTLVTLPVAVGAAALAWPLLHEYAVLLGMGVLAAGIYLFTTRTRDGYRRAHTSFAKKNARGGSFTGGTFYIGHVPVDPLRSELGLVMAGTVPNPHLRAASAPVDDLFE